MENPQDQLLADLGKLKGRFTFIETILKKSHPDKVDITLNEAYSLIKQAESLFEYKGIKVILPPDLKQSTSKLGMMLEVESLERYLNDAFDQSLVKGGENAEDSESEMRVSSGKLGFNNIVKYQWKVALGDHVLSQKEFKELAKLKTPLLKIRGNWVELSSKNMEKIQNFFKHYKDQSTQSLSKSTTRTKTGVSIDPIIPQFSGETTVSEILKMQLGLEEKILDLPVVGLKGDKWVSQFLETFHRQKKLKKIAKTKIPGFKGKLRPYQSKGVSWLLSMKDYGIGACLADDMGLGKTIQIIAMLLHEKQKLEKIHNISSTNSSCRSLIVCPMSILGNWKREINRFAPSLKVFIHHGSDRLNEHDFTNEEAKQRNKQETIQEDIQRKNGFPYDVILTTYSLAHRDEQILSIPKWNFLILDEAQNIKNPHAKRTKAIKKYSSHHRIVLTGTPIENRLSELWSLMDFLNPKFLGTLTSFSQHFIKPIERNRDKDAQGKLKELIQPFILRRLKTDKSIIKDLPKKREMVVYCNLTVEQATIYETVVNDMVQKIEDSDGIQRKGLVLSTLLKLKQICNHPSQFLHIEGQLHKRSGKLMRLIEMVSEAVSEGDKVLIFTQFREMGKFIQKYLGNRLQVEIPFLHGEVPQKKREVMVQNFQSPSMEYPIFIVSVKAGGTGLNLTAANHVFHYDRWWNPAVEDQATDRAYRIGQRKDVNVYKYTCIGTIEEKIHEIIEKKRKLADEIIGTGESWITELDTEDLKRLFALNKQEAVI